MPRATLVATLTAVPGAEELAALAGACDWVEVRGDLTGDVDPGWLRRHFPGGLLYTLRSRAEGGAFSGSAQRRRRLLLEAAARGFDMIDLEGERDAAPELLERIAVDRRLVSLHTPAVEAAELRQRFDRLAAIDARFYKVVVHATQPGEELLPLTLLRALGRSDVVAFAAGEVGAWTRLLAPRLGAAVVFAAAGDTPAAPGQPSLRTLRLDFGLPDLPPVERLYGLVGRPVAHSLSPRLHNGVYRALGIPALYLPFLAPSFSDFWLEVVEGGGLESLGLPLSGLSVTAPYKEVALAVAGAASPLAQRVGAANTLTLHDGVWEAETTDPEGVSGALGARGFAPRGRSAAVLGAGGAGRAAVLGLAAAGARVALCNRTAERGERAAEELDVPFLPWRELEPRDFDILVNATTLGRSERDELPFSPAAMRRESVVVDLVYRRRGPTPLVAAAREAGVPAVDGREVLLHQALPQIRLMHGREVPVEVGRELLAIGREAG